MSHFYFPDGKCVEKYEPGTVPSVTTVLPPPPVDPIAYWASGCAINHLRRYRGDEDGARVAWRVERDEAGNVGSEVHGNIKSLLNDKILYASNKEEVDECMDAFQEFLKSCDMYRTIATEETIVRKRWAGKRDWCVEIKREDIHGIFTVDVKTGNSLHTEDRWQVSKYSSIDESLPALLHLDKKTGEYTFKCEGMSRWSAKNTATYLNKFNAYLDLWWKLKEA